MTQQTEARAQERPSLSVGKVAVALGMSVGTIRRWTDTGAMRGFRTPGGQRRYSTEEVERVRQQMRDWGSPVQVPR